MNRRQFMASAAASLSYAAAQRGEDPAGGKLLGGASLSNITPALGCSIAGGMTNEVGTEIHDELHVRSLVLDNGQTRLALAICDLCALPREPIERAKQLIERQTGIPHSHILISATHTHSAPAAAHLFQSVPDPKYVDWLVGRIADGVRRAVNHLQPARIGWGSGREGSLVFNRRYRMKPGTGGTDPFGRDSDTVKMNPGIDNPGVIGPAGPVDPEVSVLAVESLDGRPICVLASYALHYVGGVGAGHISADYFAAWANSMAALAGLPNGQTAYPPFVPILANACSGNINNIDVRPGPHARRRPYEKMQKVADILAAECYRTWRAMKLEDAVALAASEEEVELGVRLPDAGDVAAARKILAASPKGELYRDIPQIYARETVILSESYPASVKTVVQAMRIGPLGVATFPGEAFVEMGMEVKSRSPFKPTMMIELANDYRGYIPTVEAYDMGGYETWRAKSSYLERQAAPKLVAAALRRLSALPV
jgi:neutral ceramidase